MPHFTPARLEVARVREFGVVFERFDEPLVGVEGVPVWENLIELSPADREVGYAARVSRCRTPQRCALVGFRCATSGIGVCAAVVLPAISSAAATVALITPELRDTPLRSAPGVNFVLNI